MPSKPGEPPRNRQGLLKDLIFFVYEALRRTVVIGPAKLAGNLRQPETVPEILEYGGYTLNVRIGKRVKIEPRPYMWPAYERQEDRLRPMLKDFIRGRGR